MTLCTYALILLCKEKSEGAYTGFRLQGMLEFLGDRLWFVGIGGARKESLYGTLLWIFFVTDSGFWENSSLKHISTDSFGSDTDIMIL